MSENSGKTVEVKELPSKKIRIFDDRESFNVDIPEEVQETTENCPLSVTITPMSHRDAEIRSRLKKNLTKEMNKSNRLAGITAKEINEYNIAYGETLDAIDSMSDGEKLETLEKFQVEWEDFRAKAEEKELTEYYKSEDALHDNALDVIAKNVTSLNWEDDSAVITKGNVEFLHPDLISWLLVQIESHSYLTEGEITGF